MKHTERMAEAVLGGVRSVPDAESKSVISDVATPAHLGASDATIVGSAVDMVGPYSRARRCVEEAVGPLWLSGELMRKVPAAFTADDEFSAAEPGSSRRCLI